MGGAGVVPTLEYWYEVGTKDNLHAPPALPPKKLLYIMIVNCPEILSFVRRM
jgi:hypothetical protein